jgi:hypothetical protein
MNACSLLLRSGALLPKRLSLPGEQTYDGWVSVDYENAHEIDVKVRAEGWHFMWLMLGSSAAGVGLTSTMALGRAMRSGLEGLKSRFNAAELINVSIRKYLCFHVAHVKLMSRHVQECASLGLVGEVAFRQFPGAVEPKPFEEYPPAR